MSVTMTEAEQKAAKRLISNLAHTDFDSANFTDYLLLIEQAQWLITQIDGETDFSDPEWI